MTDEHDHLDRPGDDIGALAVSSAPGARRRDETKTEPTEPSGENRAAAALGAMFDAEAGWTTAKVVVLVVVTSLMSVLVALTVADRVSTRGADSVEVGFLQDMIHHHGQAVQLGVIGIETATDNDVAHFALEAVIAQQYEVGYMEALLEEWGHGTGDPERDAMAWMQMPTSLEDMPGMASPEEFREYRDLRGEEADAAFLRLMSEHHRGGLHMAEHARDHAGDERVVDLADRMATNQAAELNEYAAKARSLGISL